MAERDRVAERLRKDWEASREAAVCAAQREHLDGARAASKTSGDHVIVRVRLVNFESCSYLGTTYFQNVYHIRRLPLCETCMLTCFNHIFR